MNYVQIIRLVRENRQLSQTDVARILETTQQQYSKYESENPKYHQEIPINQLMKLALFYNLSLDYLTGLTKEKKTLK